MDEQLEMSAPAAGHPLQGPHVELRGDGHIGFAPLKLIVQPGQVPIELTEPHAVLGRHSQADIRLAFPEVSRRHCRIMFQNGQWRILDLNSLNGIWINGERMHEAVLYDGDRLRIGTCVVTVEKGTPMRVVGAPKKSDPEIGVLQSIAEALPPVA